ncbi:ylmG homolog protein 2, chloroplastic [Diospyros lotus]|uniref:ylmG homolog protein 2, chloroplastic n=1 Tax=Diospyros lotus TaxID=55363 RepID=UPI00224D89A3|nr:ylmG homolog protein 2, chloroplastic [Diospyros lotus]
MAPSSSLMVDKSDKSSPENRKCALANRLNHPPLLLFAKPPIFKLNPQMAAGAAARFVGDLHRSIVSSAAADGFLRFLRSFASSQFRLHLTNLLSLPSNFHNFFYQIHQKNYRNLNSMSSHNFAAILPGDSVAGVVAANGLLNFLNIYNTLLVVRLVLTWFPNTPPAIVSPLSTLCDPYLNIFRGIIPPLGGTLDLSPILAFLVLNVFTSTAAALPAELPQTGTSQEFPSSCTTSNVSMSQQKWMKRLHGSRGKSSSSCA